MAQVRIDCMHEICPIPLLKALKELNKMKTGDVLIMELDHGCSLENIVNWVKEHGHTYSYEEMDDGEWELRIKKG